MIVPAINQTPAAIAPTILAGQAREYAKASKAANTQRAYESDVRAFEAFCMELGAECHPAAPATVALWVAAMGGELSAATIRRRLVSVSQWHKLQGHPSPCSDESVRSVLKGVLNTHGAAQRKAAPVRVKELRAMIAETPADTLKGLRDRALILLGFFGGFRRSELVALDLEDIAFTAEGMTVTLRRSKTDQTGEGRQIGISAKGGEGCPVSAIREMVKAFGIDGGAIFRRVNRWGQIGERLAPEAVADILKAKAGAMGLDPAQVSGHSIRRGFVTEAYASGAETPEIQAVTGHRSLKVLGGYYAEANVYRNAAAKIRI